MRYGKLTHYRRARATLEIQLMRINSVKKALAEGKLQLGTGFGQLRSQDVARILADAGFQWAFIDTEHGGFDLKTVQDICRISVLVGLCPIVRVAELQYSLVTRALDAGAQGIIFPRVESPELLAKAISWIKYPPLGIRGFGLTALQVDHEKVHHPANHRAHECQHHGGAANRDQARRGSSR